LADDLRRFVRREPLPELRNPSQLEAARNWAWRRRRWLSAVVLIGGLAVVNTIIARYTTRVSAEEHLDLGAKAAHARNLGEARGQYAKAIELDRNAFPAYLGLGHVD